MKCQHKQIKYDREKGRLECVDCGKPGWQIIKDEML